MSNSKSAFEKWWYSPKQKWCGGNGVYDRHKEGWLAALKWALRQKKNYIKQLSDNRGDMWVKAIDPDKIKAELRKVEK